ncbi:MAG: tetratricopeptide repeat protein [Roseibacillus sp.]|nr:tetratricopeptide repeat protein [Roseibacillus sp.]
MKLRITILAVLAANAFAASASEASGKEQGGSLLEGIKTSASIGNADAQCLLANFYKEGDGVTQNLVKAAQLYRMAAEQGHDQAQLKIAYCYRDGLGVMQDNVKACIWFAISASNGGGLNGLGRAGDLMNKIRKTLPSKEVEQVDAQINRLENDILAREKRNYSKIVTQLTKAGWKISMKKGADGSHNVEARKEGRTSTSHAPNWRVAFETVRRQCEAWPE